MTDYIRGAGARDISGRRVAKIAAGCVIAVLAVLVIALALQAISEHSRAEGLRRHGIAVTVTVTSCLGLASGTGITVNGYDCRGAFTVSGRRYESAISGNSLLLTPGQQLPAVADPRHPDTLSTVAAARSERSLWQGLLPAAITFLCLVIVALGAFTMQRKRPR